MKNKFKIIIIILFVISIFIPKNSIAFDKNYLISNVSLEYTNILTNNSVNVDELLNDYNKKQDCKSMLGNPDDPDSVAWLLYTILNYLRVLGPIIIVALSGYDYLAAIITSDEKDMQKTNKNLKNRLIALALLLLVPSIVKIILQLFNVVSDPMCGIN